MQKVMTAKPHHNMGIHPLKFALYLGIVSLIMAFAAFSSAYIVRQTAGNWLEFQLPSMFYVSTAVIVLSSICLRLSSRAFNRGQVQTYRTFITITFILGVAFLFTQYQGWMQMYNSGIDLKGNPSGSFVYIMSMTHAAHVLGGIIVLAVALYHAYILPFSQTPRRRLRLDLTGIYWHFVDILWIYLILFFIFQR